MKPLLALCAMLITLSGCHYDDGPVLSFRSRKARVAGNWKYSGVTIQGVNRTSEFTSVRMTFDESGGYTATSDSVDTKGTVYRLSQSGTWKFNDLHDKELAIYISSRTVNGVSTSVYEPNFYTIKKLKNKEIRLKNAIDGSEYSLVPG